MDIVTRLKRFMSALNIANSQFADTCRIPRPTVSQILNGRNKKISDELIGKIHEAYPQLSVMWLMFGEGDMLLGSNIEFSEPKIGDNVTFSQEQTADNEPVMGQFDFDDISDNLASNNYLGPKSAVIESKKAEYKEAEAILLAKQVEQSPTSSSMAIGACVAKKVIEIRVFYDDNSYEIFVPQKKNV